MKLTEEQKNMIEKNHNLIYSYCKLKQINVDDYYGDLALSLCKSVKNYNKEKGALSTYVYNGFNKIMMSIYRKNKLYRKYKFLDISRFKNIPYNSDEIDKIFSNENQYIKLFKNKKIPKLLIEEYSRKEISNILDITQACISKNIKKVRNEIISNNKNNNKFI